MTFTDDVPWHQLNLDGLEGMATPFRNVMRADKSIARQRMILAGCSRHTLEAKEESEASANPKLVRGLSSQNGTLHSRLLSLNGNPLSELRTAPLCGDLHEFSVCRAVRLYLRLQLEMAALFLLLFALSLVHIVDSSAHCGRSNPRRSLRLPTRNSP